MRRSWDGGQSWGDRLTVAGAGMHNRDGMPGVATYLENGSLATPLIFESAMEERGMVMQIFDQVSRDGGSTWSPRGQVYAGPDKSYAGAPQIAAVGGHLVAVFMTGDGPSESAPHLRSEVKVSTCPIGAAAGPGQPFSPWSPPVTLAPQPAYWPGVLADGHDRLLVTYQNLARGGPLSAVLPPPAA